MPTQAEADATIAKVNLMSDDQLMALAGKCFKDVTLSSLAAFGATKLTSPKAVAAAVVTAMSTAAGNTACQDALTGYVSAITSNPTGATPTPKPGPLPSGTGDTGATGAGDGDGGEGDSEGDEDPDAATGGGAGLGGGQNTTALPKKSGEAKAD